MEKLIIYKRIEKEIRLESRTESQSKYGKSWAENDNEPKINDDVHISLIK